MNGVTKTVIAFGLDGALGGLIRVIFYRIAAPADYGLVGYLATTAYFFAILALFGSDYSLLYYASKRDVSLMSEAVTAAAGLPILGSLADLAITGSSASAALAYFSAIGFAGTSYLIGSRRYNALFALVTSKRSIQAALMIYLYGTLGPEGAVLGIVLSMFPGTMAFLIAALEAGFGIPRSLTTIALNATSLTFATSVYVDKVILGKVMTPAEFSGYYLAFQVVLLLNATADATLRSTTSEPESEDVLLVALAILSPAGSRILAPYAPIVLGRKAAERIGLLRLTGFYVPAALLLSYSTGSLVGRGSHSAGLAAASLTFALRAILPIIGYEFLGVAGALVGFVLATGLAGTFSYARLKREKSPAGRSL